jgi:hypothetical protein
MIYCLCKHVHYCIEIVSQLQNTTMQQGYQLRLYIYMGLREMPGMAPYPLDVACPRTLACLYALCTI